MWGVVAAMYGDAECRHEGQAWQYMLSFSDDGGATWTHQFRHRSLPPTGERAHFEVAGALGDFEPIGAARPLGNMQSTIDHVEKGQERRRALLARYPDVSEVRGEYVAPSARPDAKDILVEGDVLIAYARVADDDARLLGPREMGIQVRVGGEEVRSVIERLRTEHPDAFEKLLRVVATGEHFEGPPF
jgi:hypothetical protein